MTATPFIIPVFIPQAGCTHQCVFCNQETITGGLRGQSWQLACEEARNTVREYLAFKQDKHKKTELALFGGNFLGQLQSQIGWYLQLAQDLYEAGHIDALRFSTRPDTITPEKLALLQNIPVSVIELGAQSMHNDVLRQSGRGHTVADTENAMALLHKFGFAAGLQIMPGLPGDNPERILATGRHVADLNPVCVRIYPTLVLAGSPLAHMHASGAYSPLSLQQAVELTAALYKLFAQKNIAVIRMGLQASENLRLGETILAGPYHPAFGHLVISHLFLEAVLQTLGSEPPALVEITVHSGQLSHVRGLSNANAKALQQKWPKTRFTFKPDQSLPKTKVSVNGIIRDIIH